MAPPSPLRPRYALHCGEVCIVVLWWIAACRAYGGFVDESATRLAAPLAGLRQAATADFDGDGHTDSLAVGGGQAVILRNDGSGIFAPTIALNLAETDGTPVAAACLDMDGDGDLDAVVAVHRGRNRLLLNDGTGTLADAGPTRMPDTVAEHVDIAIGDIDGDGTPDLAVAARDEGIRILCNHAGTFADATAERLPTANPFAQAVAMLDADGDGDLDLFVGGKDGGHRLLLNDGVGFFAAAGAGSLPDDLPDVLHARPLDIDGDGLADVLLAAGEAGLRLLHSTGAAVFVDQTGTRIPALDTWVVDAVAGDANVDGHPDLLLTCPGQDLLLVNNGDGTFADTTAAWFPADTARTYGAAFLDFDGDLDPDLVLPCPDGPCRVWRNAMPEPRLIVTAAPAVVEVGSAVHIVVLVADEDGIAELTVTVNGAPLALTGGKADYIPALPGAYLVSATARDGLGLTTTRTGTFEAVANVAPTVNAGPNATIAKGGTFASSGSFADPGTGPWTATVDYGDGTGAQALGLAPDKTFVLEHVYDTFGTFTVTVSVNDGTDTGTDTALVAVANQPPVLAQIPDQIVQDPVAFTPIYLDVWVADFDHADTEIQWEVSGNTLLAVQIDGDRVARITYPPGTRVTEDLTFTATDPLGGKDSCTARFTVAEPSEDYLRPVVQVAPDPPAAAVGAPVLVTVTATDDSPIVATELTVDGIPLPLGPEGTAVFSSPVAGIFPARATAMDAAGNIGAAMAEIQIFQPGDTTPPVAAITAPDALAKLAGPTPIVGTASDANLLRYTLAYAPVGEDAFVTFSTGTSAVANGQLGVLDPTAMRNGSYNVRLEVVDESGNTAQATRTYQIVEDRKIGVFQFQVVDLDVPTMGIDLEVIRAYDSTNKGSGDFGYGWTLTMSDVRLHESGVMGEDWFMAEGGGFQPNRLLETEPHYVAVVFPSGRTDMFHLTVQPSTMLFYYYWDVTPTYQALQGTTSRLVALADDVLQVEPGPGDVHLLTTTDFGNLYDPQRYRLTTREGYVYTIHKSNGLESVADRNGNKITFGPGGMAHSSGRGVAFTRDVEGRITGITDPRGNLLQYRYDAYGDLVEFEDQIGRITRYIYNDRHEMIDLIGPSGARSVRNFYDDDGRLVASVDEHGNRTDYLHDTGNAKEAIVDPLGNSVHYEYDPRGHVTAFTNELGHTVHQTYDADGNVLSQTDPLGNTTSYTYDADGNRLTYKTANGDTFSAAYNTDGRITSATDPLGNTTEIAYDAKGNVTERKDPLGNTIRWTYDANGNVLTQTDANGKTTHFEYNAHGDLTKTTDPLGHAVEYAYDANGNRTSVSTTRTASPGADPHIVQTFYEYDAANRLVSKQTAGGRSISYTYDEGGRLNGINGPGGAPLFAFDSGNGLAHTMTMPGGKTVVRELDPRGILARHTNLAGGVTTYTCDAGGRPEQVTAPNGTVASYGYDAASRVTSSTPAPGCTSNFAYDANGQLTGSEDPLGNTRTYTYDKALRLTDITDELDNTYSRTYDAAGRVTALRYPDGTQESFEYDGAGHTTAKTDRGGRTTHYTYDGKGRLTAIEDALGGVTAYGYDEFGNLTSVTDAAGKTTTTEYNDRGQPTKRTLPGGATRAWTYDDSDRLATFTDEKGQTTTNTYDAAGMLVAIAYADGTTDTMVRNGNGRVLSREDGYGTTMYSYGAGEQLLRETNPDGQVLDYTYNAAGLVEAVTTAAGTTSYTYDANGKLATVTDHDGGVTAYARDARGGVTRVDYPNGARGTAQYDDEGRLVSLEYRDGLDHVLASYAYTWDVSGNVTRVVEADGRQTDYTYDAVGRLTEERILPAGGGPAETVGYTYDAVGNRLTRTDPGGTTNYTYDDQHRLLGDGARTFSYDANGNLTLVDEGGGNTREFTYDARNRLVGVETTVGGITRTVEFQYSAGKRIRTTVDGADVTRYVVDANCRIPRVLLETDATGAILASYTYGESLVRMVPAGGDPRYYHPDIGSSTRLLTDPAGAVTDSYAYDAFGQSTAMAGSTPNPFRFAGEAAVPGADLYYLRARYYDPEIGRFVSRDPLPGDPQRPETFHPYTYAANNPVARIDPAGTDFSLSSMAVTCGIISTLAVINIVAIGTDLHPFCLVSKRDGLNDSSSKRNVEDNSFPGTWVQSTGSFGFSMGSQSVSLGMAVSLSIWSGPAVAVRHVTMDYGIQLSSSTGADDLFAGVSSTCKFMDLIMALSDNAPSNWEADLTAMWATASMVEGIIAQSNWYDIDPNISLSLNLGIAYVTGAKSSSTLDGLTVSGGIGISGGSGGIGAGLGFGVGFGINTDRSSLLNEGPWNGSVVYGLSVGASVGVDSGTSGALAFTLSLAFRQHRY